MKRHAALALLVAVTLSACASSDTAGSDTAGSSERSCRLATADQMDNIASGLTVSGGGGLANGYRFALPAEVAGRTQLIAAEITGPGMGGARSVGLWAADDKALRLMAVDALAREFSEWGTGANPGSPMDDARQSLRFTDEAKQATACAREAAG